MNLRAIQYQDQSHYPLLKLWWEQRGADVAHPRRLPTHGLMVADSKSFLCGGFLIMTDTDLAVIGNLASDPTASKKKRQDAIDFLIESLAQTAKSLKYDFVAVGSNVPGIVSRFRKMGFQGYDEGVIHLVREL